MNTTLKCGCTAGLGYPFTCSHGNDKGSAAAPTKTDVAKPNRNRQSGSAELRLSGRALQERNQRIKTRDSYCCRICKRATDSGEVDHVTALVNGGSDGDSNLQYLCKPCHEDKTRADLGQRVKTGADASGMPTSINHHWNN